MTVVTQQPHEVLQVGPLEVLPEEHLARAADRIMAREELFGLVWGRELRPGDRSVDVYVRKLRVKLEDALPGWSFIHTHFGFGYRLAAEPKTTDQRSVHNSITPTR